MIKQLVDAAILFSKKMLRVFGWPRYLSVVTLVTVNDWNLISCLVTGSNRKQTENDVIDSCSLFMKLTSPNWFPLTVWIHNPGTVAIRVTYAAITAAVEAEVPSSSTYLHMCCCFLLCVQLLYIVWASKHQYCCYAGVPSHVHCFTT